MSTTKASAPPTDERLVPVNCRYEIASANKRVDLDNLPSPAASKIIGEILNSHCLKDALTLSASAPMFYMLHVWHMLQLADSNESFNFKLNHQDVEFTVANLTVLNLPQATANNQVGFVEPPDLRTIFEFLQVIIGHDVQVQRESFSLNIFINHGKHCVK
ncbi:hypothetical protein Tco_1188505 [Tanacetum coccineum]